MTKNEIKLVQNIINKIVSKTQDGNYIFRGENQEFEKPCSNGLYRKYPDIDLLLIQKGITTSCNKFFEHNDQLRMLCELQHFGAKTTLLDFSNNLLIALFFACNDSTNSKDQDGFLFILAKNKFKLDKVYSDQTENTIFEAPLNNRSTFQGSIFVHTPKGLLIEEYYQKITIRQEDKIHILNYLNKYHGININSIYNDLHGFIEHQQNSSAFSYFIQGLRAYNKGTKEGFKESIRFYDQAIELDPDYAEAFNNRGNSKLALEEYNEAIDDFSQAIKLSNGNSEVPYCNRGNTYRKLAELSKQKSYIAYDADYNQALDYYNKAMTDFQSALRINPIYTDACINLGLVLKTTTQFDAAIAYFDKALQISPNNVHAYYNLALVYIDSLNPNRNLVCALDYLGKALRFSSDSEIPESVLNDHWKDYLQNPKFKELITQYKNKLGQ